MALPKKAILLKISLLAHLFLPVAADTCYGPKGNALIGDTPCNPQGKYSACCYSDDYCIENGLCFSYKAQAVYRGTCTDQTWKANECAEYCQARKLFPVEITIVICRFRC